MNENENEKVNENENVNVSIKCVMSCLDHRERVGV